MNLTDLNLENIKRDCNDFDKISLDTLKLLLEGVRSTSQPMIMIGTEKYKIQNEFIEKLQKAIRERNT